MFDKTITVFNQHDGIWYPKTFTCAQAIDDRGYIRRTYGDTSSDSVSVHLPVSERDGRTYVGDVEYLDPKAWAEADKANAVTFRGGKNFDILLRGNYDPAPIADSDYTGGFYKHLRETYDGVWAVNNVTRYYVLPHFELTGK